MTHQIIFKYVGSTRAGNLKFFHRILVSRVPLTNYIVYRCEWTAFGIGRKAIFRIIVEEASDYTLCLISEHSKRNVYERMRVLDLIRLGWIYLRRER